MVIKIPSVGYGKYLNPIHRIHEVPDKAKQIILTFHSSTDTSDALKSIRGVGVRGAKRTNYHKIMILRSQLRKALHVILARWRLYWVEPSKVKGVR